MGLAFIEETYKRNRVSFWNFVQWINVIDEVYQ